MEANDTIEWDVEIPDGISVVPLTIEHTEPREVEAIPAALSEMLYAIDVTS